jgi:hypothetical protein
MKVGSQRHVCVPAAHQPEQLVHHRGRLFGDWLFSVAAFGVEAPDPEAALLSVFPEEVTLLLADLGATRDYLLGIRQAEGTAIPQPDGGNASVARLPRRRLSSAYLRRPT